MTPDLHLHIRSIGVRFRSHFNGVPLAFDEHGKGFSSRAPLNEWLSPFGNRVEVEIFPPAERQPDGTEIEVAVTYPEDTIPALQRFFWRLDADLEVPPFVLSFPFASPVEVKSRLWQEAFVLEELSPDEAAAARRLATKVYDAFATRDLERIMELLDYRVRDVARAWGDEPAEDVASGREAFAGVVKAADFELEPLDPAKLELTPCGNHQLLLVTRAGAPLVATTHRAETSPATIPVYLARLESGWIVAR
jgi:hypothetical protein